MNGKKIIAARHLCPLLIAIFAIVIVPTAKGIDVSNDRAGAAERSFKSEMAGGWHFVRTPNPNGGPDAISIMHTADTSKSDLDLAGLMIRCREGSPDVVIVLLRAFPLRARPRVSLGRLESETRFEATVAAPGTAILLPGDAATLVNGSWRDQKDIFIRVDEGQTTIRGVVTLAGLQGAFKVLVASCPGQ
jgi:hypothetical protein